MIAQLLHGVALEVARSPLTHHLKIVQPLSCHHDGGRCVQTHNPDPPKAEPHSGRHISRETKYTVAYNTFHKLDLQNNLTDGS